MAFPAGSMQPKIEASRRFVAATGHPASIGALNSAAAPLAGTAATTITRGERPGVNTGPRRSRQSEGNQPMTHSRETSTGAGRDAAQARLQLTPNAPASTHLDGAWWPRSTQLAIELPVLFESLSEQLGEVAVVGYHRNGWTPAPPQMQIGGDSVQLQGFTSDEPATVILIGRDGRRVTLQVISPGATETVARRQFDAASKDMGDFSSSNDQAERVAASVTDVAAQLADHEGRGDPGRTAQIARWCEEAAQQFVNAPVQQFVPILVHHIVRSRMGTPHPAA